MAALGLGVLRSVDEKIVVETRIEPERSERERIGP